MNMTIRKLPTIRNYLRECNDPWILQLAIFNMKTDLATRLAALNNPVCPQWVHPIHATLQAHFTSVPEWQLRFSSLLKVDLPHKNPQSDEPLTLRYDLSTGRNNSVPIPPHLPRMFHVNFRIHVDKADSYLPHNPFGPASIDPHVLEWFVDGKYQNVNGPSQIRAYSDRIDYHFKGRDAYDVSAAGKACDYATNPAEVAELTRHADPVVAALAAHNPVCPLQARIQWGLVSAQDW